jgi:hypothetical protein
MVAAVDDHPVPGAAVVTRGTQAQTGAGILVTCSFPKWSGDQRTGRVQSKINTK